jgi:hypothetical protein
VALASIEPSVPPWLEAVVMRALSKGVAERQQTMEELGSELGARAGTSRPLALVVPKTPSTRTPPPGLRTPVAQPMRVPPSGPLKVPSRPGTLPPTVAQPTPAPIGPYAATQMEGQQSTTLSGAAAQLGNAAAPKKSKTGLIAAVAGVVVVAAGVTVFLITRHGKADEKPQPVAKQDPPPKAPDPPPKAPDPPTKSPDPPTKSPDPPTKSPDPPAAVKVKIHLTSTPAGAEVFEGDNSLGKTPLDLERDKGSKLSVSVRASGYRDEPVELALEGDVQQEVKLEKHGKHEKPPIGTKPDKPTTPDKPTKPDAPTKPDKPEKPPNQVIDPFKMGGGN